MPTDARLLLRAAVASSSAQSLSDGGIKDRFASYHPKTRALRCTACDFLNIKHESLWASHAASKSHRSNVAKLKREEEEKEMERKRQQQASAIQQEESVVEEVGSLGNKRKERGLEHESSKRAKKGDRDQAEDLEWERFQREVLDAPSTIEQPSLSTYAEATIEVAPALRPGVNGEIGEEEDEVDEEDMNQQATETDAERRSRLEREDREEILARLEEEQRLQDEADERVSALKNRFEKLKQARAAKK